MGVLRVSCRRASDFGFCFRPYGQCRALHKSTRLLKLGPYSPDPLAKQVWRNRTKLSLNWPPNELALSFKMFCMWGTATARTWGRSWEACCVKTVFRVGGSGLREDHFVCFHVSYTRPTARTCNQGLLWCHCCRVSCPSAEAAKLYLSHR